METPGEIIRCAHSLGESIANAHPGQRQLLMQLIESNLGKRELLRGIYTACKTAPPPEDTHGPQLLQP